MPKRRLALETNLRKIFLLSVKSLRQQSCGADKFLRSRGTELTSTDYPHGKSSCPFGGDTFSRILGLFSFGTTLAFLVKDYAVTPTMSLFFTANIALGCSTHRTISREATYDDRTERPVAVQRERRVARAGSEDEGVLSEQ